MEREVLEEIIHIAGENAATSNTITSLTFTSPNVSVHIWVFQSLRFYY